VSDTAQTVRNERDIWMWTDRGLFGFSLFWAMVAFLSLGGWADVGSLAVTALQVVVLIQQWRQQKWAFFVQIAFGALVALYLLLLMYVLATGRGIDDPAVTGFVAVVSYLNVIALFGYSIYRLKRWEETTW
jgi:hypothetical protein